MWLCLLLPQLWLMAVQEATRRRQTCRATDSAALQGVREVTTRHQTLCTAPARHDPTLHSTAAAATAAAATSSAASSSTAASTAAAVQHGAVHGVLRL